MKNRTLGRTGLKVSEIGFGGHSWSYSRVPKEGGGNRRPTVKEITEMLAYGCDIGVNFIDGDHGKYEHEPPGEALRRLKKRDKFIICCRWFFYNFYRILLRNHWRLSNSFFYRSLYGARFSHRSFWWKS